MRVGINTAVAGAKKGYRQTGVSRYVSELIDGLKQVMPRDDTLVTLGQKPAFLTDRPMIRILWEQTGLPLAIAVRRLDAFHGTISVVPWLSRRPSVVTVHDLAFLRFPEQVPKSRRMWLVAATRISVRKAHRVITVSQRTADDLIEWLGLPAGKIEVIPLAPSTHVKPVTGTSLDVFRMKWNLDRPYVLAVGTLEPRKNLPTLLRAFSKIKDEVEHQLVLVGPEGWLNDELKSTLEELNLGDRVRLTGFVSDEELGGWYSGADLFAFPSFYEGFGLPSVEAMRCGAPVIASDSSCFPEVIGDAGVLIPPKDVDLWATTMRDLLKDPERRAQLTDKGYRRADDFSWERTASETYRVYRELAG